MPPCDKISFHNSKPQNVVKSLFATVVQFHFDPVKVTFDQMTKCGPDF